MANFTKKAIRDSFIQLLNEKPLSRITVRDIVEDCNVNRNTFYYYYQDIPQLLESVIDEEAERIIREHPSMESIEECLTTAIEFIQQNRRAVLHIFQSSNRDIYEQYQWRVCNHVVTTYIDRIFHGRSVSPDDRRLIIDYTMCLCFGFIYAWLDSGMQDDIVSRFHRMCELKQGEVERMIAKCEIKR
ncbi:MAG: TetR/AcrR family transcriptional regulator [Peptoniphilaceae bacterium]|nr:TetR/AcrR family transcriptional regulator [Peptoniphilaceae bacterium]MDY5766419.1 TetR/AcrR family transcriptional regulator [Peptoniphilaceae bacterium]